MDAVMGIGKGSHGLSIYNTPIRILFYVLCSMFVLDLVLYYNSKATCNTCSNAQPCHNHATAQLQPYISALDLKLRMYSCIGYCRDPDAILA